MSATIFTTANNSMSTGFVYKWTYLPTGQYYIGIHNGSPEDGYTGSGKRFCAKWKLTDQKDWHREILFKGHYIYECVPMEAKLVNDDTLQDALCLNLIPGGKTGWKPLKNFSSKKRSYRTKPQRVKVRGQVFQTRMSAIKQLNITFAELDHIIEQQSYNDFNRY
jgi:hypothetical protein